jgi:hypothetical protein
MGRTCNTNRAKRNPCRILMGKPEGKRPLGRPRYRWVDSIKMDIMDGMDWIDHKFLPSVCVSVCVFLQSLLGNISEPNSLVSS